MEISKIYEENGYIITEYDNGTIEKSLKSDENVIIKNEFITENELLINNILLDLEYIKCSLENNNNI